MPARHRSACWRARLRGWAGSSARPRARSRSCRARVADAQRRSTLQPRAGRQPRRALARRAARASRGCASGSGRCASSWPRCWSRATRTAPRTRHRGARRARLPAAAGDRRFRQAACSARDTRLLDLVRAARVDAARERAVLIALERRQRLIAIAVRRRRDALAGIEAGLRARQAALAAGARGAPRRAARTRAGRRRAQHELNRLLAARRARRDGVGPGRPMGDPVAGRPVRVGRPEPARRTRRRASGYYQITDATWHGLGGSTHARLPGLQGRTGPPRRRASGTAAPAPPTGSAPSSSASSDRTQGPVPPVSRREKGVCPLYYARCY